MLDELLGRAELKARIEELEEENHHLQRQLDAESERRADAVSDKQAAEKQINQLEDRIAELEDRVERSQQATERSRDPRRTTELRGDRLEAVLTRLESFSTGPEGAFSAVVTDDSELPAAVTSVAGESTTVLRQAAPTIYYTDDADLVAVALRPPILPEPFTTWDDTFQITHEWFQPTGRLVFGVVRADLCAVGVYEGTNRESFEGFESDVKSDHGKGGFSQSRFERIRDEQIAEHLDDTRELLTEVIESETPDRVILTGETGVLNELSELADHTASTDAGGKPAAALEHAFRDFWTTRLVAI